MKRLVLLAGVMLGCSQANPVTISQHNPARYGTVSIRVDLSNITASELEQINAGIERAKALGPNFVVVNTQPDVEIIKTTNVGCTTQVFRSSRRIQIGDQCFSSTMFGRPDAMITAALAYWVGNQAVCRPQQIRNPNCQPCSNVGTGPAISNAICGYDPIAGANDAEIDPVIRFVLDAGGVGSSQSNEITQLDLDEYRRNHP